MANVGHTSNTVFLGDRGSHVKIIYMFSEPLQVIKSTDLRVGAKGFGISFSSAVDVDDNNVADLAIG